MQRRITEPTRRILASFLAEPSLERYGAEISKLIGVSTGTLYPALKRMEEIGWLESRWEQVDPAAAGRPRRRHYRLTVDGRAAAEDITRRAQRRNSRRRSQPRVGQFSPEMLRRLKELDVLFLACRDTFGRLTAETDWRPSPASYAARDQDDLSQAHGNGVGPRITTAVHWFLYAAAEQTNALAALYAREVVMLAPHMAVRAIVEDSAQISWILGDLAGEPAETRLARAYLVQLRDAEEAKMNVGRLYGKTGTEHRDARTRYESVKKEIDRIFPGPLVHEKDRRVLRGQTLPRLEESVVQLFAALPRPLAEAPAKGMYGWLSNHTHPTLYPVRDLWRRSDGTASLAVDVDDLNAVARIGIVTYYEALSRTARYHGWTSSRLAEFAETIEGTLPGTLGS